MQLGWAYDGVNASVPRNVGPACANYLSAQRHWLEGAAVISVCLVALRWAWRRAGPLPECRWRERPMATGKKVLLLCMTFTLGLELGFKLSSRSVIYILNPCHITTMMQIYLLVAKPSKFTTGLFRLQLNYLNGPLLAYLFPEIDSRRVALERQTYYVQHGLMFVIPIYMLNEGGHYNMEALTDINWNVMGMSLSLLYHFIVLELFAIPSQVNLNHMLCPAILDPFEGANFRLFAVVHQSMLCPLLCKLTSHFCVWRRGRRDDASEAIVDDDAGGRPKSIDSGDRAAAAPQHNASKQTCDKTAPTAATNIIHRNQAISTGATTSTKAE